MSGLKQDGFFRIRAKIGKKKKIKYQSCKNVGMKISFIPIFYIYIYIYIHMCVYCLLKPILFIYN